MNENDPNVGKNDPNEDYSYRRAMGGIQLHRRRGSTQIILMKARETWGHDTIITDPAGARALAAALNEAADAQEEAAAAAAPVPPPPVDPVERAKQMAMLRNVMLNRNEPSETHSYWRCVEIDASKTALVSRRRGGDFSDGRFVWVLERPRIFQRPVPARGHLGLWNWDPPAGTSWTAVTRGGGA